MRREIIIITKRYTSLTEQSIKLDIEIRRAEVVQQKRNIYLKKI